MTERFDKLGRRIPEYDRSTRAKKAAETRKKNRGKNDFARAGSTGGKHRTRGYFGLLKDKGETDKLKAISEAAVEKSRNRSPEEKHQAAVAGWKTRRERKHPMGGES